MFEISYFDSTLFYVPETQEKKLILKRKKWSSNNYKWLNQEYPELEGTTSIIEVKLLGLHMTHQESHHMPESVTQTLVELWQTWGCDHFPRKPVPVHKHSLAEEPESNLNLPWQSSTVLFTRS